VEANVEANSNVMSTIVAVLPLKCPFNICHYLFFDDLSLGCLAIYNFASVVAVGVYLAVVGRSLKFNLFLSLVSSN
jgi:hypothetical protein